MLLMSYFGLFAQSGMTIQGGGTLTVNGNLSITPVFVCGQVLTDTRDGKTYSTVLIGAQCWMAQNLNVGARINGPQEQTNNSVIEKYCSWDDGNNCTVYGGLYQWDEAMQYSTTEGAQGICPTGWHLPTDAEWTTLTAFLGGEAIAGGKMKEAGFAHWSAPNTGATNSSGFTALPGGYRDNLGHFPGLNGDVDFWSSTQTPVTLAWARELDYSNVTVYRGAFIRPYAFSVRCMKDN